MQANQERIHTYLTEQSEILSRLERGLAASQSNRRSTVAIALSSVLTVALVIGGGLLRTYEEIVTLRNDINSHTELSAHREAKRRFRDIDARIAQLQTQVYLLKSSSGFFRSEAETAK